MSSRLENALAECLEAVEEGRLSIEQCRERYPEEWKDLRRLLPLVSILREAPPVAPSFNFRRDARRRLIAQLSPRTSTTGIGWLLAQLSSLFRGSNIRTIKPAMQLIAILLTMIILATGVGAAYASDDSLPGDTLYPIKIGVEKLQLLLTFDDANEAQLQIALAQRRIGEMKGLAERGGFEDIQTAAEGYQSLLNATNETIRGMVLAGDPRTAEIGGLVEETLFYDTLILTGLKDLVPMDMQGTIDFAIGASKSGNAIARQWVGLSASSTVKPPSQFPSITQTSEDIGIPLPTDIACWPSELGAEPPDGVPICEEDQTPVPLPQNLILFCWPKEIPFDPPQRIPRCEEGQEPIKLPDTLNLICWPKELPYDPPEGLRLCEVGELPLPLPEGLDLRCWPSEIPYDPPDGIPYCTDGSYPTPAPQQLPCWPRQLPSDPPPGIPLCEPGAFRDPINDGSDLGGIRDRGAKELLDDIRSQLIEEYCWPAWLDQKPPLGMPICPTN